MSLEGASVAVPLRSGQLDNLAIDAIGAAYEYETWPLSPNPDRSLGDGDMVRLERGDRRWIEANRRAICL